MVDNSSGRTSGNTDACSTSSSTLEGNPGKINRLHFLGFEIYHLLKNVKLINFLNIFIGY